METGCYVVTQCEVDTSQRVVTNRLWVGGREGGRDGGREGERE